MKIARWLAGALCALFIASVGWSADAPPPMQPTEQHKALEVFVGDWAGKGEMKEGPYGPGGPLEWGEECRWFGDAGFHVVCRSKGSSPMGPMQGLGIMGYDAAKKAYTHYGIDTTGWSGSSQGTVDGNTWSFQSQETMGDQTFHSRYSMTMESPTRMTFVWETSADGETWNEMMSGVSEKR